MTTTSHPLKEKQVSEIAERIKNSKTLMIVSIKGLPSKQFQDIKKSLRDDADIRVSKKNILLRAIKEFGKESILPLEDHIQASCALAFSNMEGYELAALLSKNKTPVFAKAGQEAPEDIEVKEGPTDLVPGPAISELGSLGLQVVVEGGKLSIKKSKVVIRKGQIINETAASILQKLNIQPFTIGLEPTVIYDIESEKIYTHIKIDSEEVKLELISAASKALGFAQKIVYYARETIGYFLAKANMQGEALGKFEGKEDSGEVKEDKVEEKKEESIIEKAEDKIKEVVEEVKEVVEKAVEKVEKGVKKVIEKVEGKKDNTQLNQSEEKA